MTWQRFEWSLNDTRPSQITVHNQENQFFFLTLLRTPTVEIETETQWSVTVERERTIILFEAEK